jgi:hypothetical protein
MRRSVLILALALTVSLAVTALASARPAGKTRRDAELHVILSVDRLRALDAPFVNDRTNTLYSNTRVTCVGAARTAPGRYTAFVCTLRYRQNRLRVKYTARTGGGFALERLPARAVAAR